MKITTVLMVIGFLLSGNLYSEEITNEKKTTIKELMELTGAAKIGEMFSNAFVQQMTGILKTANPDIPPRALTIVEEEVTKVIKEEMIEKGGLYELIYPIYDKYFTLDDINELIAFYKTPIGKKTIRVMPKLAQESMLAGQIWGESLGPIIEKRIVERFEKEGIK